MTKPKLTATYQGVTATRRSDRPYTHVVFGLYSPARQIDYYRAQIAAPNPGASAEWTAWIAGCAEIIAELEAKGNYWKAVSWHQGPVNAQKGLRAAQEDAGHTYLELVLVEVDA